MYSVCSFFCLILQLVNYLDFSQDKINHSVQTTVHVYKYTDFVEYHVSIFMNYSFLLMYIKAMTFLVCILETGNVRSCFIGAS